MHSILSALVAATLITSTSAQACTQSGGNWYCNEVKAVSYFNFGSSGTYNQVSYMSDDTGECKFDKTSYGGAIGPFDEELSIHIRGPFSLKQFAFYTPSTSKKVKRHRKKPARRELEERQLADTVSCPGKNGTTFSTGGKTFMIECAMDRQGDAGVSSQPNFASCIQKCASTSGCTQVTYVKSDNGSCYLKSSSAVLRPEDYVKGHSGARLISTDSSSTSDGTTPSTTAAGQGSSSAASTQSSTTWTRRSYYNSKSQTASGVTFMNNLGGGTYPGIWSTKFGNSLGYASSSGLQPAMSPTVLADMVLPSTSEMSLWTSAPCTASNPCPYSRPKTVANHGFAGSAKIFLFEFSMPHDASGADMPALWFLNAQIPRTQQYGGCSCWGNTDGCGELDVWEVLTKGEERMISAVHGLQAATNPNWFARPTSGTMKGAVVLMGKTAHIKVLDDNFDYATGLTDAVVAELTATAPPRIAAKAFAGMTLPK